MFHLILRRISRCEPATGLLHIQMGSALYIAQCLYVHCRMKWNDFCQWMDVLTAASLCCMPTIQAHPTVLSYKKIQSMQIEEREEMEANYTSRTGQQAAEETE